MQKERPGLPGRRCCVGPDSGSDRSVRRRWPYRPTARAAPAQIGVLEIGRKRQWPIKSAKSMGVTFCAVIVLLAFSVGGCGTGQKPATTAASAQTKSVGEVACVKERRGRAMVQHERSPT